MGANFIILQGKNSFKGAVATIVVSLEELNKTAHQLAQCREPDIQLCFRTAINHLVARLIQDTPCQGELIPGEVSLEDVLFPLPYEQAKGLMDQFVMSAPSNVVTDELAVHAHHDLFSELVMPGVIF